MARPLRIQMPGLCYHVYSRGNRKMDIYLDDRDREAFLDRVADAVDKFRLICHAYCLMRNHYHLVITTQDANFSAALHNLNGRYSQWWNWRHERVGHMFQGRPGATIIQADRHLLVACAYTVMNPVRKELVDSPDQWQWSSYRATAGFEPVPSFLKPDTLWRLLGGGDVETETRRYRSFVGTPMDAAAVKSLREPIVGDPEFVRRFDEIRKRASREVPRRERRVVLPLDSLFAGAVTRAARNARAAAAVSAGYSRREIADYLGVDRTTVSKMIVVAGMGSGVKKLTLSDLTPQE